MSRSSRLAAVSVTLGLALSGCKQDPSQPLGPRDSFLLFAPAEPRAATASGLPVVRKLEITAAAAEPLRTLFATAFAGEVLRTVYLAQQFVRDANVDGRRFPEAGRAAANDALPIVLGEDREPYGRGLAIARSFGAPTERPQLTWLGFGGDLAEDRALVQKVSGRLATYAVHLIATGGTFAGVEAIPRPLADGYRMAMEVIAREWRVGTGPQGVVAWDAGTPEQRALFADVRENRFVLTKDGAATRPAAELLADAGVAATVIYRLAQAKGIAGRPAPAAFYAPFVTGRVPEGVSPAAVLGAFRNFQAKLLGAWGTATLRGRPPQDIAHLVELYASTFPAEKAEAIRIFVVTTFGATVNAGSASPRATNATATLAALDALTADVIGGRRTLRDAAAPGVK